jgi:septal ring factor EnvC (AmiA/AmiB activator)
MATDSIDLTFLGRQQEKILSELNSLRQESRQVRAGFTTVSDYMSRLNKRIDDLERRIIDMREDTEAMIKLELGGAIANLETRLDERSDQQFDRFYQLLDERLPAKS